MSKLDDLQAEWEAVKNGNLEPDPIKIAEMEAELQANPPIQSEKELE